MADLKSTVVALGILMPALAALMVCLRIQSRRIKKTALAVDDYLAVAALVCLISFTVIAFTESDQVFSIALSIVSLVGTLLYPSTCYVCRIQQWLTGPLAAFLGNLGGHLSFDSNGAPSNPTEFKTFSQVCRHIVCSW